MTYDDLLTRLDGTLEGPGGEGVARRLRARWPVVLVDEFQDTDPVQWNIMRRAFGEGTLVLIGDPKQAIYAFRGADVYAYLEAARAGRRAGDAGGQLAQRPGADRRLRRAVRRRTARARGDRLPHRARDGGQPAPAAVGRAGGGCLCGCGSCTVTSRPCSTTAGGYARNASARAHIAADLAADLVRLLSSPAEIERRADDGSTLERSPIRPGHVAVLVQTNRAAAQIRDALEAVDIPAVINGAGSVFGTAPARDWLRLLEAIERPTYAPRARAAALTPFLGWSAERVASAGEEAWAEVHRRLHGWARLLRVKGIASLAEAITLTEGLPERILATADGERDLTDLRHIGQLLHAAAVTEQLGTTALVAWLRRRIAEAAQDTGDEDRSRRLESDAEAVQVLTVHRSKGLEFPIVYYPYLWEPGFIPAGLPVAFHDPDAGDVRTIDVGLEGPDFDRHKQQHLVEQRGEDLRLAYVALTRAQHQAVVWWAGSWNSRDSALGRLLFARDDVGTVAPVGRGTPTDAAAWARFEALAVAAPGCISVERSALGLPASWSGSPREPAELSAARFDRELDWRWRRTSFSDITAGVHEARVASEPEETVAGRRARGARAAGRAGRRRGPAGDAVAAGRDAGRRPRRHVRASRARGDRLRGGRPRFASSPRASPRCWRGARSTSAIRRRWWPGCARRSRHRSAVSGCATWRRADRLDELDFEFPLVGGDEPTAQLVVDAIADVLRAHLPPGDPLAGYADRLGDPILRRSVRGYVTGSIDLVLRAGERFSVVDYKSNWLGRDRRGADGLALPPGRARGRDGARPLRPPGAALHRRAASLPALAAPGLRRERRTSAA